MATASPSRRGSGAATPPPITGTSLAHPPSPSVLPRSNGDDESRGGVDAAAPPPIAGAPTPRPPVPSASPRAKGYQGPAIRGRGTVMATIHESHQPQDGEMVSLEKRKGPNVKRAKASGAKRFKSPMVVKSPGIKLVLLQKLVSPPRSSSPVQLSPSQGDPASYLSRNHGDSTLCAKKKVVVSMVLDNDDLLAEVLLRVSLSTSLVRAALVCRRWLRVTSGTDFLLRFHDLHPPRALGFFVQSSHLRLPKFVLMPHLPPELAASAHRVSSALDAYEPHTSEASILDCQNGHLLIRLKGGPNSGDVVLSPLHPARGPVNIPPLPSAGFYREEIWLMNDFPDGSVTVRASLRHREQQHHRTIVNMYELRDGAWYNLITSTPEIKLSRMPVPVPYFLVPVGDNMCLISSVSSIATLRSASSETADLLFIALPEGVEMQKKHLVPWEDDSVILLIQVDIKELKLRVWLYTLDTGNWLLEDTICLRKIFADSGVTDLVYEDGLVGKAVILRGVGPRRSAMCVLLQVGTDVLYIDINSRTAEKVYTVTPEDGDSIKLLCVTTIFPPRFPVNRNENTIKTE